MPSPSAPLPQQSEFPVAQKRAIWNVGSTLCNQKQLHMCKWLHNCSTSTKSPASHNPCQHHSREQGKHSWPSMALAILFSRQSMGIWTGLLVLLNQHSDTHFPSRPKILEKYLGCCWPDLEDPRSWAWLGGWRCLRSCCCCSLFFLGLTHWVSQVTVSRGPFPVLAHHPLISPHMVFPKCGKESNKQKY